MNQNGVSPSTRSDQSRFSINSVRVKKFLEEAEATYASQWSSEGQPTPKNEGFEDVPDPASYIAFDQLSSPSNQQAILVSQWECLVEKTKQRPNHSFQLPTPNVTGILYLCRALRTNFNIRFRAMELYDRYLKMFTIKMAEYFNDCCESVCEKAVERFESQVLLRMCTCILIASKLHADTQIRAVTTEKIRNLLKDQGLTYTTKAVATSETRVLETLDFKCHWVTPLELVEQLLAILNLRREALQRAHYFSILLLEYCYLDLEKIRHQFSTRVKSSGGRIISNAEITIPLQCAAIVSAALFIVATEFTQNLHKVVAQAASLPDEDVSTLAVIILDSLHKS